MGEIIRALGLLCHQYVDGMLRYLWLPSDPRVEVEELGCALEWMRMYKLRLNPNKTEVLVVGRDSALSSGCTCCFSGLFNGVGFLSFACCL